MNSKFGYQVTHVNGQTVTKYEDFKAAYEKVQKSGKDLLLTVAPLEKNPKAALVVAKTHYEEKVAALEKEEKEIKLRLEKLNLKNELTTDEKLEEDNLKVRLEDLQKEIKWLLEELKKLTEELKKLKEQEATNKQEPAKQKVKKHEQQASKNEN